MGIQGVPPTAVGLRQSILLMGELLMAACLLGGAEMAYAQASQPAPPSAHAQQNAEPAAQSPAGGPMVMGENPDSTEDTASPPAAPVGNPAPASSTPGTVAPWQQPNPSPATSSAFGSGQPLESAAAPGPPAPIPVPADAGGDAARQQINDQCANLLKMADDLKTEVDKTNKDVLSVSVVRTADAIEQLARRVKDEMRPATGKN